MPKILDVTLWCRKLTTKSIEHLVHEAVLFDPELFQLGDFSQELVQFMMAYLTKLPSGG